jgi:hypothetical protein
MVADSDIKAGQLVCINSYGKAEASNVGIFEMAGAIVEYEERTYDGWIYYINDWIKEHYK